VVTTAIRLVSYDRKISRGMVVAQLHCSQVVVVTTGLASTVIIYRIFCSSHCMSIVLLFSLFSV